MDWIAKVNLLAYSAMLRKNYGCCNIKRKAEAAINETIKEFIKIYPHSRRYETRRYNREHNTKDGTFLDAIKGDPVRRSIFLNMLMQNLGEEDIIDTKNILGFIVKPLAERRNDKSKGYNGTLRLVYGKMPVCWKKKKAQTGLDKKDIILSDPKLQKMFRKTVQAMLDELNENA